MTIEQMKVQLEELVVPRRFIHSINVMNVSVDLARRYREDQESAAIGGLLHDCARNLTGEENIEFCEEKNISVDRIYKKQPELLHGEVGTFIAKEYFGVENELILNAIRYHTTGCDNMTKLEKIVYLADFIEPNRYFPGIDEIRKLAFKDLDTVMIACLERTMKHVLNKGGLIHPNTLDARNSLILRCVEKGGKFIKKKPHHTKTR